MDSYLVWPNSSLDLFFFFLIIQNAIISISPPWLNDVFHLNLNILVLVTVFASSQRSRKNLICLLDVFSVHDTGMGLLRRQALKSGSMVILQKKKRPKFYWANIQMAAAFGGRELEWKNFHWTFLNSDKPAVGYQISGKN